MHSPAVCCSNAIQVQSQGLVSPTIVFNSAGQNLSQRVVISLTTLFKDKISLDTILESIEALTLVFVLIEERTRRYKYSMSESKEGSYGPSPLLDN